LRFSRLFLQRFMGDWLAKQADSAEMKAKIAEFKEQQHAAVPAETQLASTDSEPQ
jgi:hypothetical protein